MTIEQVELKHDNMFMTHEAWLKYIQYYILKHRVFIIVNMMYFLFNKTLITYQKKVSVNI